MELDDRIKKTEKTTKKPLPRLAKTIIATEFILEYVMASQFYILEKFAHIKMNLLQETVIYDLNSKRAIGAFLSIVPAWLADSYTGKYWAFSTEYMVSCFWPICLLMLLYPGPMASVKEFVYNTAAYFSLMYYCIEPVRFVIISEQLELPQQEDNLPLYFSLIFLVRSIANTIVTILFAVYRLDETFIFGHAAIIIILYVGYVFFFMFLKKSLKGEGPVRFIYMGGIISIVTAITRRLNSCGKKENMRKDLMDYAENKCDIFFIYNSKVFLRLSVFGFLTIFVGVSEFLLSKICFEQMKHLVPFEFLPTHYNLMDIGYIIGILWFVVWNLTLLPLLQYKKVKASELQLFILGHLFTGLALASAFIVQFMITQTSTMLPGQGFGQMRIFNAQSSVVAVRSRSISNSSTNWIYVPPRGLWTVAQVSVKGKKEDIMTLKYSGHDHKTKVRTEKIHLLEEQSVSYIISETELITVKGYDPLAKGPPGMNDPLNPRIYVLCGLPFCFGELIFKNNRFIRSEYVPDANDHYSLFTLPVGTYNVTSNYGDFSNIILRDIRIEIGGVYSVLIYPRTHNVRGAAFFTIVEPNRISIAVIIPQIIFMSCGYLFRRVYGFIFVYTQSPPKLRCTTWVMAPWAFAVANIILYIDHTYWHHRTDVYQITMYLVIHFTVICLLVYYSFHYEFQRWCPEGAVFQGYPPMATRLQAYDRRTQSYLDKTTGSRSSREPRGSDRDDE